MTQNTLIVSITKCQNWRSFYALGEQLPRHGLFLGETLSGNRILCRIQDGQPCHENIFDDYLILGTPQESRIPDELKNQIVAFVAEHASDAQLASTPNRQQMLKLYGSPLTINGEHRIMAEQRIRAIGDFIEESV